MADSAGLRLFKQKLASAEALSNSGNASGAFRAFEAIVRDPKFDQLPAADQRHVFSLAGSAAIDLDKTAEAQDFYRRATELDSDDPDDWYRLAIVEYRLDATDRANVAMRHFIERWPELLPNVDPSLIPRLIWSGPRAAQSRYELMQALFYANWQDPVAADSIWYQLALAQIQRGQLDSARQTIRRVDEAGSIVSLRADKRFDAIVDPDADAFDPVLAARRKIQRLSDFAQASPGKLDPTVQLTYAMLDLGMYEQVIALADKTIDAIVGAPVGEAPFTDIDQQVWVMNNRAIALSAIGRPEDALTELKRASTLTENGQVNVSQALNLGDYYCRLQRPRDALAAIALTGTMSDYGRMFKASVEHCAALELGDEKSAERAMSYLLQHEGDASTLVLDSLLRASRMDEAAGLVRKLLSDGYTRGAILSWMQEFIEPEPLRGDIVVRENRRVLLARPDIIAALEPVGRIERFALYDRD